MEARHLYFKGEAVVREVRGGVSFFNRKIVGTKAFFSGDVAGKARVLESLNGPLIANLLLEGVETDDQTVARVVRPYVGKSLVRQHRHDLAGPILRLSGANSAGGWSVAATLAPGLEQVSAVVAKIVPAGLPNLLYGTVLIDVEISFLYAEDVADPLPAPEPPVSPQPDVRAVGEVVRDASALSNGFVWKPVAEGGRPPVALIPPEVQPHVRNVSLNGEGGNLQEVPTFTGLGNPVPVRGEMLDRGHYRFRQRATAYASPSILRVGLRDGYVLLYAVSNPRSRTTGVRPTVLRESAPALQDSTDMPEGPHMVEGRAPPVLPLAGRWFTRTPDLPFRSDDVFVCYADGSPQLGGYVVVDPDQTDPMSEAEVSHLFRESQVLARQGVILDLGGWALTGLADHHTDPPFRPHLLQFFHDLSDENRPLYFGARLVGSDGLRAVSDAWGCSEEKVVAMLRAWTDFLVIDTFHLSAEKANKQVSALRRLSYDKPIVLLFDAGDRPLLHAHGKNALRTFVRKVGKGGTVLCLYGAGDSAAETEAFRLIGRCAKELT